MTESEAVIIGQRSVDYIEYISYMFIDKYQRSEKTLPAGVLYNKYMTLVNRKLIDSVGTDIKLPHCWYRWGDEVVRYSMPYLDWNHDDPTETTVSYTGSIRRPSKADDTISFAESFADDFLDKYSGPEGAEMAIDEVYVNVPYKFQNDFRMLRENLKISKSTNPLENHLELVETLYEQAMNSFPEKDFSSICSRKDEFVKVFDLALKNKLSPDRLQDISECFWFYFCYHLRLDPAGHYNVPDTTLGVWRDILPEVTDRYDMMMQNYVGYMCPNGSDDPVLKRMLKDRRDRLDEVDRLFSDMES